MIVNVPLNAIGEERPHVPQPRPAYNQGSYIACARGAKFNFVLFVHVKSSSRPCPRATSAAPRPPRLHRDEVGGGQAGGRRRRRRDFAGAFMERRGGIAQKQRGGASTSLNAAFILHRAKRGPLQRRPLRVCHTRHNGTHSPPPLSSTPDCGPRNGNSRVRPPSPCTRDAPHVEIQAVGARFERSDLDGLEIAAP